MFHSAGGIAVGCRTEIVAGRRRLLLPDWCVYDLLKVGKGIDILHPTKHKHKIRAPDR
jgi:hypothetical protein